MAAVDLEVWTNVDSEVGQVSNHMICTCPKMDYTSVSVLGTRFGACVSSLARSSRITNGTVHPNPNTLARDDPHPNFIRNTLATTREAFCCTFSRAFVPTHLTAALWVGPPQLVHQRDISKSATPGRASSASSLNDLSQHPYCASMP